MVFSRTTAARFCAIASFVMLSACFTSEQKAKTKLEENGCTDVTLEREDATSFKYKATCDGEHCEGSITIDGSSANSTQICFAKKPEADTAAQKKKEGPGKVLIGKGGVTGPCSKAETRKQLEATLPKIKACYDKDLENSPDLTGTLDLVWDIDSAGEVEVAEIDSEVALVDCVRGAIGAFSWKKPREATCRMRWSLALYTGEPPEAPGHERYPRMDKCADPIDMKPGKEKEVIALKDFSSKFEGVWEIEALSIRIATDEDVFHVKTDEFGDPPEEPGAIEARETLVCHTQNLVYTTTTTKDKDGKETTTRKLGEDDATKLTANITLPADITAKDGSVNALRTAQGKLLNGKFFLDTIHKPNTTDTGLEKMMKDLQNQETPIDIIFVREDPTTFTLSLAFTQNGFQFSGQGVYKKVK